MADFRVVDIERFWGLIDQARTDVDGDIGEDGTGLAKALTARLAVLGAPEIAAFAVEFRRLRAAADRWDVWGAAYLIGGGCDEGGFLDFRSGLVGAGRQWYEAALADPDSLAGHPSVVEAVDWDDDSAIFAELVGYAADEAFRESVGADLVLAETPVTPTAGERWDFDDDDEMRRRLPRLSALVLGWPANEGCRC